MIDEIRRRNPNVKVHCWFSLECTNFSNAKGGQSRDADSRTLAEHTDRYVIELNPHKIWIENVKEFELWGPMIPKVVGVKKKTKKKIFVPKGNDALSYYSMLIASGHVLSCPMTKNKETQRYEAWMIPCPERKGADFKRWRDYTCSFGYNVERRIMNCADYGVPQHRIRLIMQFAKFEEQILWPEKTHDKKGANGLPKWLPVGPCLDMEDEGESVLSFKKQKGKLVPRITSDATIDRLINGSDRFVIGNKDAAFLVKYLSNCKKTGSNKGASIKNTSPTVTCQNRLGVAQAHMLDYYFGNGYTKPISEPAGVSGTKDGIAMHTVQFLSTYHTNSDASNIADPSPAVMTKDKHPLISVDRLIMDTQFNNGCHTLNETARTQTANRKHFYLVNFQWFTGAFRSIDRVSNAIIGSLHKAPNYLIVLETGELAIEVFKHDPPHYRRLKKYMADNGIVSINMRMLKEVELLQIMSMDKGTKLSGNSTDNKKMIGNAVPPMLVAHLGGAYGINSDSKVKVA